MLTLVSHLIWHRLIPRLYSIINLFSMFLTWIFLSLITMLYHPMFCKSFLSLWHGNYGTVKVGKSLRLWQINTFFQHMLSLKCWVCRATKRICSIFQSSLIAVPVKSSCLLLTLTKPQCSTKTATPETDYLDLLNVYQLANARCFMEPNWLCFSVGSLLEGRQEKKKKHVK